jgi:hypothetical protein
VGDSDRPIKKLGEVGGSRWTDNAVHVVRDSPSDWQEGTIGVLQTGVLQPVNHCVGAA